VRPVYPPIAWEKLLEGISGVRAITVPLDNHRYLARTELKARASEVLRAVGVRLPPLVMVSAANRNN
jgi:hypothetical protein